MSADLDTASPRQEALDLPWPRRAEMTRAHFIVSRCNADALTLIEGWRDWPEGRMALCGPEGGGKSHLAAIWAREAGARFLEPEALAGGDVRAAASHGRLVIEDFPRRCAAAGLARRDDMERGLFHLVNVVREQGGRLLLTGRTPPARWAVGLPDLASRLAATALTRLESPDDDLLGALVAKLFEDRALRPDPKVSSYLATRIERSFAAAQAAVERLDAHALQSGEKITIKTVKECFAW